MIKVEVWPTETSQPLEYKAQNTYTKGGMYCMYLESGIVVKFPMCNLFRVEEEYGEHGKR